MKPVFKKFVTFITASILSLGLLGAVGLLVAYIYITPNLPEIDTLKDVKLQVPLRVYSREGDLMAEFGEMKRSPLSYDEFPDLLIKAVLSAEDDRFFEHPGVDYQGILRAAYHLIRTGEKGQGGSTITMQVARNFFLSREKTFLRKFNEIFLALKIEEELSKEDILALYLNKIYLGKRAYGFAAAAQVYYGKKLDELGVANIAMIAGLPKAPSRYNPVVNPERAVIRRNYVLGRMHSLEFISDEEYKTALESEDEASVHGQDIDLDAPYVAEMVRSAMLERFGNKTYTEGYRVVTTVESRHQKVANQALRQALLEYDRRHGYRGTLGHKELFEFEIEASQPEADPTPLQADETATIVEPAVIPDEEFKDELDDWKKALKEIPAVGNLIPAIVFQVDEQTAFAYTAEKTVAHIPWDKLNWARRYVDDTHMGPELEKASDVLAVGDIIYTTPARTPGCSWLAQLPIVGGALVALRPNDGSLQAAVGGFDFYESKFNRVIQAKRQPGSSFKPFIYTAALDKGYTAASVINDAPVVFEAPGLEDTWRPENYSGKFYGPTRLRQALIKSRNLVSIRLMRDIGIGYSVRYTERFGFNRKSLPRDLSLSLGSGSVTPLELAQGYAVFANAGYKVKANFIDYVQDAHGNVVWLPQQTTICEACYEKEDEQDTEATAEIAAKEQRQKAAPKVAEQVLPPQPVVELDETISEQERQQIFQGPRPQRIAAQLLTPQTAFLINTMMRDVISYGTGRRALAIGRKDLAGKTGTTNDQQDAWFAGFNRDVVTIAWVGFDNPRPLGNRETGAIAALPMWISYMRAALKGVEEKPLKQPKGIVSVRIDPKTGKLANARTVDAIFEYFLEDQVPTETQEAQPAAIPGQEGETPQSGASDITEQLF